LRHGVDREKTTSIQPCGQDHSTRLTKYSLNKKAAYLVYLYYLFLAGFSAARFLNLKTLRK